MQRSEHLFAIASAALLISGLLLTRTVGTQNGMSISWPGSSTTFGIDLWVPCYGIAALFGAFACVYAIPYWRLSTALAPWHFWLSLTGVLLFAVGFTMLGIVASESLGGAAPPEPSKVALAVTAIGLLVGPVVFLSGQLIFVLSLMRAVAGIRHQ